MIVLCPWCGNEYETEGMFPPGYELNEEYTPAEHEVCCTGCGKDFMVYREVKITYRSAKEE